MTFDEHIRIVCAEHEVTHLVCAFNDGDGVTRLVSGPAAQDLTWLHQAVSALMDKFNELLAKSQ